MLRWVQNLGRRKIALLSVTVIAFVLGIGLVIVAFASSGPNESRLTSVITPFAVSPTPTVAGVPTPTPTAPPSTSDIARMKVPSLGIDFAIEPLGILPDNSLDTPHDANNKIGWYHMSVTASAAGTISFRYDAIPATAQIDSSTHVLKPGYGTNSVFSAHESWNFKDGPFKNLNKANPGDLIIVDMADGTEYTYKIFSKQRYDEDSIPMGDLIWPKNRPADKEWITLITCGGNFIADQANGLGHYTQRDVVIAERVS